MKPQVTKESLAQWIAELESQPHLSLREERYLAVMKYAQTAEAERARLDRESQNLSNQLGACDRDRRDVRNKLSEMEKVTRTAHDTLMEINEHNYTHRDVVQLNNASVEAILCLAPVLGENHGHSEMWWAERMCNDE